MAPKERYIPHLFLQIWPRKITSREGSPSSAAKDLPQRILSLSPGERACRKSAYWDIGMAMDKLWHILTMEHYLEMKETAALHNNMSESQRHYAQQEKPDMKEYILHGSIYMKF